MREGLQEMETHPGIVSEIRRAISEEGIVQPNASEKVRQMRQKVSAVEGRLRGILNGHSGEISEHVRPLTPDYSTHPPGLDGSNSCRLALCCVHK